MNIRLSLATLGVICLQTSGVCESRSDQTQLKKEIESTISLSDMGEQDQKKLQSLIADQFDKSTKMFNLKDSGKRRCLFSYVIDSNHRIKDVRLVQTSNYVEFDDAVCTAIKNLDPDFNLPASTGTIEFSCDLGSQVDHRPQLQDASTISRSYHSDDLNSEATRAIYRAKRGTYKNTPPFYY